MEYTSSPKPQLSSRANAFSIAALMSSGSSKEKDSPENTIKPLGQPAGLVASDWASGGGPKRVAELRFEGSEKQTQAHVPVQYFAPGKPPKRSTRRFCLSNRFLIESEFCLGRKRQAGPRKSGPVEVDLL
ncbi:hypothetical protein JRQ81_018948 [Phrynocephalus forsythii]|uniref:Uncharacterized protein n=1 Tax=Phrynocephalus forsythii TaxID=171643 RepID=A0A9Q0XPZ8_9SAUR|nr:hypothetical protein JRQ81_018948 [Phrynocephalus forsythii]